MKVFLAIVVTYFSQLAFSDSRVDFIQIDQLLVNGLKYHSSISELIDKKGDPGQEFITDGDFYESEEVFIYQENKYYFDASAKVMSAFEIYSGWIEIGNVKILMGMNYEEILCKLDVYNLSFNLKPSENNDGELLIKLGNVNSDTFLRFLLDKEFKLFKIDVWSEE